MRRKPDHLIPLELAILETGLELVREGTLAFHGFLLAKALKTSGDHRTLTAHGTLYRALHRLERAGLIEASWEDSAAAEVERRPRRRLYRVTALAEPAVRRARMQQRSPRRLKSLDEGLEPS